MAGALFDRIKTWIAETLTFADLNAEIQNIIDKFGLFWIDDFSATVAQMKITLDPGSTGGENQATSGAEELQQIRFVIARILGASAANWYDAPSTDLSLIVSDPNPMFAYAGMENEIFEPTTTGIVANLINRGWIVNPRLESEAGFRIADFNTTNKAIGTYSWDVGTRGDSSVRCMAYPGKYGNPYRGTLSAHFRNFVAGDYIAFNPATGQEIFLDASGFLTFKTTLRTSSGESTKNSDIIVGDTSRAGNTDFQTVAAKWTFNDYDGASTDLMELERDNVDEGTQLTADDIDINGGSGGNWIVGARPNNPAWDLDLAMDGLPTAHSTPWTANGTAGNGSVSGGILTINSAAGTNLNYSIASNVNLTVIGNTLEWKFRFKQKDSGAHSMFIKVRDDSGNVAVFLKFTGNGIGIHPGASDAAIEERGTFVFTPSQFEWHVYRLTLFDFGGGITTARLFIDGVHYLSVTQAASDATAGDIISFGELTTTTATQISEWEYFRVYDGGTEDSIAANQSTDGQLDDVIITTGVSSANSLTNVQTLAGSSVYEDQARNSISMIPTGRGAAIELGNSEFTDCDVFFGGDGRTSCGYDLSISGELSGNASEIEFRALIDFDVETQASGLITEDAAHSELLLQEPSGTNGVAHSGSLGGSFVPGVGLNKLRSAFENTSGSSSYSSSAYKTQLRLYRE